ncbi:hypothetical protein F4782DRAFT_506548, partial [Xylaria castorea]
MLINKFLLGYLAPSVHHLPATQAQTSDKYLMPFRNHGEEPQIGITYIHNLTTIHIRFPVAVTSGVPDTSPGSAPHSTGLCRNYRTQSMKRSGAL